MKKQWMNIACQKAFGSEKAMSGYPPKTCGYDKKGFGLAEVIGSSISIFRIRILHENS